MRERGLPCIAIALVVGCGSSVSPVGLGGDTSVTGAGSDSGGLADGGFYADGIAFESGVPLGSGCSADLRTVVDRAGNVKKTCAKDQGCAFGDCVPACDAAKAAHSNLGCDFMVPTPSFIPDFGSPCFAVFVANNWPGNLKITVSQGGASYDVGTFGRIATTGADPTAWPLVPTSGVPEGKVAVLFVSHDPTAVNKYGVSFACPVPAAINMGTAVRGSGMGKAFHIVTDVPVSAYDIVPFGGAKSVLPSAELLLPTTAWGTNYVGVVPPLKDDGPTGPAGPRWAQIVAQADNTRVDVVPPYRLAKAGTVPFAPDHAVTSFSLNAGEYVQWEDSGEITGMVVSSDKPVAFHGGNGFLCVKSDSSPTGGGCDSAHQQIPPVSALGSEYAVAPYATRRADGSPESIWYRIVGLVDGTTLTVDPPVASIPATLKQGEFHDFQAVGAFIVASQGPKYPFYLAQVMSGGNVTGGSRAGTIPVGAPLGDEEFVNVLPPAQYLDKYVFFTDPTYATTNLVITRTKTAAGFKDVSVDCLGKVTGFQPIGASGKYEQATVDLVRAFQGVGGCANGPQAASSEGPFGITVWGLDRFASYAYPAGGNVASINPVVVPLTIK